MKQPSFLFYGLICLFLLTHCQRAQQSGGPGGGTPPIDGPAADGDKPLNDAPTGIDDLTGSKDTDSPNIGGDSESTPNTGSEDDIDNQNDADSTSVDDILNNNGANSDSNRINNNTDDGSSQNDADSGVTPTPTPPPSPPPGNNNNNSGGIVGANCKFGLTDDRQYIDAAKGAMAAHEILVYIAPKLLTEARKNEGSVARVGFLKALFHTSFNPQLTGFSDVSDGNCAVYKVNLQTIWGDSWQANWQLVAASRPAIDTSFDKARQPWKAPSAQESSDIGQRVISAQRLAYNIVYPTNYVRLIKAPGRISGIEQGRTLAAGGYANGIPCGPRVLHIRESKLPDGTVSYLFTAGDPGSPGEPGRALPASPPRASRDMPRVGGRRIAASETMQQLANGFFRYFIFRNPGSLGTKALQSGVIDPGNPTGNYHLVVGRSCIACHNNGIRGVPVDTANSGNGWSTGEEMEKHFVASRDKYKAAMATLVKAVSGSDAGFNEKLTHGRTREPIAFLLAAVEGYNMRGRPYGSCRQAAGDKYAKQLQSVNALVSAQMAEINQPSTPSSTTPDSGTTPDASAQSQPSGGADGAAAYNRACASCHPSASAMKGKPIPADMWTRGGIGGDQAAQAAIREYLR